MPGRWDVWLSPATEQKRAASEMLQSPSPQLPTVPPEPSFAEKQFKSKISRTGLTDLLSDSYTE